MKVSMWSWWTPAVRITALVALAGLLVTGAAYFKQDAEWRELGWTHKNAQLYYLPSIPVLERASLGHRSFLADLIWIRGLLYVGSHFSKQRGSIDWLPNYVNTIIALDPKFRYAYIWGSILVVYNRKKTTRSDVVQSIHFLKRGQQQFPHDYYFPYGLAMSYLSELTLSSVSTPQLLEDFEEFCSSDKRPVLKISPRNRKWKPCLLEGGMAWMDNPHCRPKALVHGYLNFWKEIQAKQEKRIPFIRQIKQCLRKKAALYLMEAASKEGAPVHYAPLAARILRRDGNANAAICDRLLDVIWRAESDEVRNQVREKLKRYCGGERPREIICQEEIFARRWRQQFGYLPRATFQMLDLPPLLENHKPLAYPLPTAAHKCRFPQNKGSVLE